MKVVQMIVVQMNGMMRRSGDLVFGLDHFAGDAR
jgi:hypothetical protein